MSTPGRISDLYGTYDSTIKVLMDSPINAIICSSRVTKALHQIVILEFLPQLSANFQQLSLCATRFQLIIRPSFDFIKMKTIPDVLTLLAEFNLSPNKFENLMLELDWTDKLKENAIVMKCVFEDLIVKNCFDIFAASFSQAYKETQNLNTKEEIKECLDRFQKKEPREYNKLTGDEIEFGLFESSFVKVISQQMLMKSRVMEEDNNDLKLIDFFDRTISSFLQLFPFKCNYQALIKVAQFTYKEVYIPAGSKRLSAHRLQQLTDEENTDITVFKSINDFITVNQLNCDPFKTHSFVKDLIEYRSTKK